MSIKKQVVVFVNNTVKKKGGGRGVLILMNGDTQADYSRRAKRKNSPGVKV